MGTPYYQVEQSGNTPLMAVANVTAAGAVNLTSTNDGRLVGIPYTKAGTLRFSTEEEIDFELVNKITPNVLVFPEESNITGTCTADVDSITVTVNGVEYRGGVISGDKFEFYIVDKVKNVNDTVTINAFDKAGKLIDKKDVIVKAAI
ncbi:hypothetical protein PGRAN_15842 [Listeria grandensis FSL F6-0971]|uniref:Bacterial Ig domain-containing protein n=2 Tax=Listeria grandensis TaxID=1494963 RepID=W7BEM3_9LIST|nr:hypothetical protein PGRAN_15842 [Listeria grandensis FSL F6-0971]